MCLCIQNVALLLKIALKDAIICTRARVGVTVCAQTLLMYFVSQYNSISYVNNCIVRQGRRICLAEV